MTINRSGGGGGGGGGAMLTDGLDSDWSGLHERNYLNGHPASSEGQVDMLDIPGKGRCSVYIARWVDRPPPLKKND